MRSTVLAGRKLGIEEFDEGIWLVCFTHCDLGYFDLEQKSLQPTDNPFGTRSSPGLDDQVDGGDGDRETLRLRHATMSAAVRRRADFPRFFGAGCLPKFPPSATVRRAR